VVIVQEPQESDYPAMPMATVSRVPRHSRRSPSLIAKSILEAIAMIDPFRRN